MEPQTHPLHERYKAHYKMNGKHLKAKICPLTPFQLASILQVEVSMIDHEKELKKSGTNIRVCLDGRDSHRDVRCGSSCFSKHLEEKRMKRFMENC